MPKRILSLQSKINKFLLTYLRARSVPHFSTKKEIRDHIGNNRLLKEKCDHSS